MKTKLSFFLLCVGLLIVFSALFQPQVAHAAAGQNGIFGLPTILRGPVDVFGIARHEEFRKWQLDILIDGEHAKASFIAVSDQQHPELTKLTTIETAKYPDGKHTLRLRVAYTGLQYEEFVTPITISNAAQRAVTIPALETPEAEIEPLEIDEEQIEAIVTPAVAYNPNDYQTTLKVGSGYQVSQPISRNATRKEIEASQSPDVVYLDTSVPDGVRWIEIDLSEQKLVAYQGNTPVMITQISSGRETGTDKLVRYTETVTGRYKVQKRYEAARMAGPGYDTPNVPYIQYFFRGYAIHGAFWHNEFGMPVSHGCINMRVEEARQLFAWATIGTEIVVHE